MLEISVLGHVSRHGLMAPGEIAAVERVQPQTQTRTVCALEARGCISRHAGAEVTALHTAQPGHHDDAAVTAPRRRDESGRDDRRDGMHP